MSGDTAISVAGLHKRYGDNEVLKGVDLEVPGGRSIGVTGQFSAIDEFHPGRENLKLMADLNHLDRGRAKTIIDELLERFGEAVAEIDKRVRGGDPADPAPVPAVRRRPAGRGGRASRGRQPVCAI